MIKLEVPTLKEILEEIGGNEQLLDELLKKFRLWLKQQLHLPQDVSDQRLKFFICTSKFNLEKAKKHLDMHYTIRNVFPEIFSTLDPTDDSITQCFKYSQWVLLPQFTPEKYRINICRLIDFDSSLFEPWIIIRYGVLMLETRIEEDVITSDIFIVDCTGASMGHVIKYTPTMIKKIDSCLDSFSIRIKGIYLINAPNFTDMVMTMIKSIVKTKLIDRVHTYTTGIESLDGIIPKSMLPADYGGEQPSMATLSDMWRAKLLDRRDWFLEEEKLMANESLRTNSVINPDDLFGVSGTFQKLDFD